MEWPEDGRRRVFIEQVRPVVDCGRAAIKRVLGEAIDVEADVIVEGHERIACALLHAPAGSSAWTAVPMTPLGDDRWTATSCRPPWGATATPSPPGSMRSPPGAKSSRGGRSATTLTLALREGAGLVARRRRAGARRRARRAPRLCRVCSKAMRRSSECRQSALSEALRELMAAAPDRSLETVYDPPLEAVVERPLARFSAWYEFFPRSVVSTPSKHGTFADAARHLEYVADDGIRCRLPAADSSDRRRPSQRPQQRFASDGDGPRLSVGHRRRRRRAQERAFGARHTRRLRELSRARPNGSVSRWHSTSHSNARPTIRTSASIPPWFARRPDGSVQYAENPPKKYEDIYPLDFGSAEWRELWQELRDVVEFWIDQGVRVFRVDNPHTKPFEFWRWLIADVQGRHPDTLFLAEAFSRPRVMFRLAKLGFSQSYTYFTWRNTKQELTTYFTELAATRDYFRPNLWPNTPDILHEYLQTGGRPAFMARAALAATLGAS